MWNSNSFVQVRIQNAVPILLRWYRLYDEHLNRLYIYIYIYISDINTRLATAWRATDRLSVIWKSDLTDKIKRSFFQAVVVSILLYGCTSWTLTKRMKKRLDGSYTRIMRTILEKSWRKHPQSNSCTVTYLLSRNLSKIDEPYMRDTAVKVGTSL